MKRLKSQIRKILHYLPSHLRTIIAEHIEIRGERRSVLGKAVDATYDVETGRILLWNFAAIDDCDLVIVLTHELGHLLFHKSLTVTDRQNWLYIYTEESVDFGLEKEYSALQVPEETFCCICSVLGVIFWLEGLGMDKKAKKVRAKIKKTAPKGSVFVEGILHRKKNLYHSTVRKVREWIEEETGPIK